MKKEKEFIIEKIKEVIHQSSNTTIGYEYDEESLIHFIKVKPLEIYETKDFKKLCSKILFEYINKYSGSICFISENDSIMPDIPEVFINPGKIMKYCSDYEISKI